MIDWISTKERLPELEQQQGYSVSRGVLLYDTDTMYIGNLYKADGDDITVWEADNLDAPFALDEIKYWAEINIP
jgi:hypothetical protein